MATLFLWSVVACTAHNCYYDWRSLGQFPSVQACEQARNDLGLRTSTRARCVLTTPKATNV